MHKVAKILINQAQDTDRLLALLRREGILEQHEDRLVVALERMRDLDVAKHLPDDLDVGQAIPKEFGRTCTIANCSSHQT